MAVDRHSVALVTLHAGRLWGARDLLCGMFDYLASPGNVSVLINTIELGPGAP